MISFTQYQKYFHKYADDRFKKIGYNKLVIPEYKGTRTVYYSKQTERGIGVFSIFQLLTWRDPQAMQIYFITNIGEIPKFSISPDDKNFKYWSVNTLSNLLIYDLGIKAENFPVTNIWEFQDSEQLISIINTSVRLVVDIALPYYEKKLKSEKS